MEMLRTEVIEATQKKFSEDLMDKVTLVHFTQEPSRLIVPDYLRGQECMFCKETKELLTQIVALSDNLELILYDFVADKDKADDYGIDKIPATLIHGKKDYGIRFFGIPSGYEYMSLVEAITDVSKNESSLKQQTIETLQSINKDVHIQTFVTPTCPYCTMAVRLGHQFAIVTPRIKSDMVEATEFPHLIQKYNVVGVPKTIINETHAIEGAIPEEMFLEQILKAVKNE